MKVRVFITTGDELQLQNICKKFDCKLQIGGPPNDFDSTLDGFERVEENHAGTKGAGRSDWMVVYLIVSSDDQALGIRAHFKHYLST